MLSAQQKKEKKEKGDDEGLPTQSPRLEGYKTTGERVTDELKGK